MSTMRYLLIINYHFDSVFATATVATVLFYCCCGCYCRLTFQRALDIKRSIHGHRNLSVATAEEDLSYALYVLEYSSGNFESAREHICKSIEILRSILPMDHLLLSSARRVKALILEEIALDVMGDEEHPRRFNDLSANFSSFLQ